MNMEALPSEEKNNITSQEHVSYRDKNISSIYKPSEIFKLIVNIAGYDVEEVLSSKNYHIHAVNSVLNGSRKYINALKRRLIEEIDPYDPYETNIYYALIDVLDNGKINTWENRINVLISLAEFYKDLSINYKNTLKNRQDITDDLNEGMIYLQKISKVISEAYNSLIEEREDRNISLLTNKKEIKRYLEWKDRIVYAVNKIINTSNTLQPHVKNKNTAKTFELESLILLNLPYKSNEDFRYLSVKNKEENYPENDENKSSDEDNNLKNNENEKSTIHHDDSNIGSFRIYEVSAKIADYAQAQKARENALEYYISALTDEERNLLNILKKGLMKGDASEVNEALKKLYEKIAVINEKGNISNNQSRKDALMFLTAIAYTLEYIQTKRLTKNELTIYNNYLTVINENKESTVEEFFKYKEVIDNAFSQDFESKYNDYYTTYKQVLKEYFLKESIFSQPKKDTFSINDSGNVSSTTKEESDEEEQTEDNISKKSNYLRKMWDKVKRNHKKILAGIGIGAFLLGGVYLGYKNFNGSGSEGVKQNVKKEVILKDKQKGNKDGLFLDDPEWNNLLAKIKEQKYKAKPDKVLEILENYTKVDKVIKRKDGVWWVKSPLEQKYYRELKDKASWVQKLNQLLEKENAGYKVVYIDRSSYEGIAAVPLNVADNKDPIIYLSSVNRQTEQPVITKNQKDKVECTTGKCNKKGFMKVFDTLFKNTNDLDSSSFP